MMNEKNTIRSEIRAASRVTERTMETAIVRGDPSETRTARRIRAAASVALYWSLPGEVFTHDLVERWSRSKRIYLPVMQGDGLILKRFTDRNDLREARFGVQEPVTGETAGPGDMELIVVPGVAFDRQGNRLGHGKGFYDRLLHEPGLLKAGVCFDYQMQERIPCEAHDVAMDLLVCGSDRNAELIECRRPRSETARNA